MKKTKIYLIVTILVFLLSIVLVACGDKPSQDTPTEQEKKYTVTFVVDGEDYFTLETSGKSAIELPSNPTKDGYEFVGWYFDVNVWLNPCNSTSFANENLTANVTVYARWELIKETYSVTFVGGTGATGDAPTMEAKAEGDKFDLPQNTFVKEDYDFDGWFDGQTKYAAGDEYVMPSYAVTFTAQWVEIVYCNITYDKAGAEGEDPQLTKYPINKEFEFPTNPYEKDGYYFKGWLVNDVLYQPAEKIIFVDTEVTITASWIKLNNYSIEYYNTFNVENDNPTTYSNIDHITLKPLTRNGYIFKGWRLGTEDGLLITEINKGTEGRLKLYADWQKEDDGCAIVESDVFSFVADKEYKTFVTNDITGFDFRNKFVTSPNTSWRVFSAQNCDPSSELTTRIAKDLQEGDNLFYVMVENLSTYEQTIYQLNVHKQFNYKLNFRGWGKKLAESKTMLEGDRLSSIEYPDTSINGYLFVCWCYDETLENECDMNELVYINQPEINLYSKFALIEFTVTYDLNTSRLIGDTDGIENDSRNPSHYNVKDNYKLYAPHSNDQFVFLGWYFDNIRVTALSDLGASGDVLLQAKWKSVYDEWWQNLGLSFELNEDGESYSVVNSDKKRLVVTVPSLFRGLPVTGIKESTFEESELIKIALPNTIVSIGKAAFKNSKLQAIEIPNGITEIAEETFFRCSSLTSVNLPESLVTIGKSAFAGCRQLSAVNIPSGVNTIGEDAFLACGLKKIVIPGSVQLIETNAFSGNIDAETIILEDAFDTMVVSENVFAFSRDIDCTRLFYNKTINLYVGSNVQLDCKYLLEVWCTKVSNIAHYLDLSIFINRNPADVLAKISVQGSFGANDCNVKVYYSEGQQEVGEINKTLKILYSTATFEASVFYNASGEDFKNGTTVDIFDYCFDGIRYRIEGNTASIIEASALLKGDYTIKDGIVLSDGRSYRVTGIGEGAFAGCTGLTNIIFPDSITSISKYAFAGCTSLKNLVIPNHITNIAAYAFSNCGLENLVISDGVLTIEKFAFYGCNRIESITLPFFGGSRDVRGTFGYIFGGICAENRDAVSGATYQYSSSSSAHYWYYIPSSIKNVVISDSATAIPQYAFRNCKNLISITIPDSVTDIGIHAFDGCSRLTNITIPDSVTGIGDFAFSGCKNLTNITIPNSMTSISYGAFNGCSGLTSITIPDSVTSIDWDAFRGCSGLTSVTIPDSVTIIEEAAFEGCTGLTSIIIPDSVKYIGQAAFNGCSRLTRIDFQGTKAEWESMSKDVNWKGGLGDFVVYCTDGTISKSNA